MRTKTKKNFPQIRLTEVAYKQAQKVAKNRGESLTEYVSSLILKI
jgi:hypothetical protein